MQARGFAPKMSSPHGASLTLALTPRSRPWTHAEGAFAGGGYAGGGFAGGTQAEQGHHRTPVSAEQGQHGRDVDGARGERLGMAAANILDLSINLSLESTTEQTRPRNFGALGVHGDDGAWSARGRRDPPEVAFVGSPPGTASRRREALLSAHGR
ncbi:hypothetical protein T484DRAFT_1911468 [Baffinella frigidus]|nr:hypothetical protein T484DRAFT_1911468 [Cryptophyta sp. CCMP2293]